MESIATLCFFTLLIITLFQFQCLFLCTGYKMDASGLLVGPMFRELEDSRWNESLGNMLGVRH